MEEEIRSPLPSINRESSGKMPLKDSKIKRMLQATKLYGCQCGFSEQLQFKTIESHAKRVHKILIDTSPDNYIVQIDHNKQYYTYFLNPRPPKLPRPQDNPNNAPVQAAQENQARAKVKKPKLRKKKQQNRSKEKINEAEVKQEEKEEFKADHDAIEGGSIASDGEDQHEVKVKKPVNKFASFCRLINSYIKILKANPSPPIISINILSLFLRYIKSVRHEINVDESIPNDLCYFFNDFIMRMLSIKQESEDGSIILSRQYVEVMRAFWLWLKEKKKTKMELALSDDFITVKQEEVQ